MCIIFKIFDLKILLYIYFRPEEIFKAKKSQSVYAVKLYPAGATTNSELGVTSIDKIHDTLHAMSEVGQK